MSFGSQRWFPYTDDEGTVWGIRADESNIEMIDSAADGLSVAVNTRRLPSDIEARKLVLRSADGGTKTIPVLSSAKFIAISTNQAFSAPTVGEENPAATSFVVVQKIPERIFRAPYSLDTGKTDGDNP
jgi:hypothetical protein